MAVNRITEGGLSEAVVAATPNAPDGTPAGRARFFNAANAFNIKLPAVPATQFVDEMRQAFADDTATGEILMDNGPLLDAEGPATTPLVLARYLRVRSGETLSTDHVASGEILFVIRGSGETVHAGETLAWGAGDILFLTGGETAHKADADSILWCVTNEPALAFDGLRPDPAARRVAPVHIPAQEVERQLSTVLNTPMADQQAGMALIFSQESQERRRNIMPSFTLAMNTLGAGGTQRAHRHNSVAVTLAVAGENCWSRIGEGRMDWVQWATSITPPGDIHSHHNEGSSLARFLIVQDGGLHYYARTMGFSFEDD